jgi:hypothetical protein
MAEMPNETSIGAGAFGGSIVDSFVPAPTAGKGDAALTLAQVPKLVDKFSERLDKASAQIKAFAAALKAATGSAGTSSSSATTSGGAIAQAIANSKAQVGGAPIASAAAMGGGGSGFFANMRGGLSAGGGAGYANLASGAMQMGGQVLGAIDARTNSAYPRMLQNDQLAVLYQQTQGISQQQYYNQLRQPIQGARLGAGGINSLLALQARTGIQAGTQANAVAGMRAVSGYSFSTDQMAQMLQTLASPQVNNRMTMTLGTGLYGIGGKQRSMTEIFQNITRGAGLTNARVVQGAMQQGSMSRARLSAMGVPEDMQDLVLQYAQSNVQFQNKTGGRQGMYNPESKTQRQTMGIEANFASQREETTRLSELRDETYYNRQKDNLATMEQNTQALIKLQTTMEDLASGLIGSRISTRGSIGARALKGAAGLALMGGAAALTYFSGATAAPLAAGLAMTGAGMTASAFTGGAAGDPVERGRGSTSKTSRNVGGTSALTGLNNTFKSRLAQMMEDNPNVKLNQGFRSSAEQRSLFFSRYTRSHEPTGTFWGGSHWKKNPNVPDAAPPGMSMHEVGLAADLAGDLTWVQQNAHKYGLKTFSNKNEPWHVQPAELPDSRREYEKLGAPWGRSMGAERFDARSTFSGTSDHSKQDRMRQRTSRGIAVSNLAARGVPTGGGAPGHPATVRRVGTLSKGIPSASEIPRGFKFRTTPSYGGFGYYVPNDFTDADLEALHRREQETWTVGPVTNSHGTFYGGFSMNDYNWNRAKEGLAKEGVDVRGWKEHANDTVQRQKMAAEWLLEKAHAHNGWEPIVRGTVDWPGVGKLPSIPMPNATESNKVTIKSSKGDPTDGMPMRGGGGNTTVVSGGGITIAPNIYIQSAGNNVADARRAAQEVAKLMTQDIKRTAMRSL